MDVDRYARIQQGRGNRLALILDLAVPRDFDPKVGALSRAGCSTTSTTSVRPGRAEPSRARRAKIDRPCRVDHRAESRPPAWAALRHRRHAVGASWLRQLGDYADTVLRREAGSALRRPARPDRCPAHGDRPHDVTAQQPAPASAARRTLHGRHRRGHRRTEVLRRVPAARSARSTTLESLRLLVGTGRKRPAPVGVRTASNTNDSW